MKVIAAVMVLGVATSLHAQEAVKIKQPPPTRVLASKAGADDVGRYVFGQINDFRADQYLLDTKTGRMWSIVTMKDSKGADRNALLPVLTLPDSGPQN